MGREIRRVDADWQHPRNKDGDFVSMYDEVYDVAAMEWISNLIMWANGTHEDLLEDPSLIERYPFYWDWSSNAPDRTSYREEAFKNPVAYQIYETVSEGSPVSPVFQTKEEMIAWMTSPIDRTSEYNKGEDWQCMQGMTKAQAENFIKNESSPSMISIGGKVEAGHRSEL